MEAEWGDPWCRLEEVRPGKLLWEAASVLSLGFQGRQGSRALLRSTVLQPNQPWQPRTVMQLRPSWAFKGLVAKNQELLTD